MRIVLSLSNYLNLTGSELYVYELARELAKRQTHVTILANQIGGEIVTKTINGKDKINVYPFFDHPELSPDLVISSQPLPTNYCLRFFPQSVHMQVLHSVFAYEEPIIHKNIKQYICVRPEIEAHWTEKYPKLIGKTRIIWNGVNPNRFHDPYENVPPGMVIARKRKLAEVGKKVVLYVGTFDHLRRFVIQDLIQQTVKDGSILHLVLPHNPFDKMGGLPENVRVFPATWDIEKYVKDCDQTAGIFVGRTTIEGFMCGKPGLVYDVDEQGKILKKYTMSVPKNREIFDIKYMTDKIIEVFEQVRYE